MRHRSFVSKALLLIIGIVAVVAPILSQQTAGTATPKPAFEVVSIKPGDPAFTRISVQNLGNRFVGENLNLKMLAAQAYGMPQNRVIGGPSWIDTDRFHIEARAEGPSIPQGQLGPMLQSMLEDRFQLKAHRETRELPIYELVIARGGPKLKLSEDQTPPTPMSPQDMAAMMAAARGGGPGGPPPGGAGGARAGGPPPDGARGQRGAGPAGPAPRGSFNRGNGQFSGSAVRLTAVVNALSQQLGRPVIDKTGLDALYDISLKWTPGAEQVPGPFGPPPGGPPPGGAAPPPAEPSGPSIFTALQEQLGLRLDSTRGPVEVVVIDSAQKPTEN